jgi:hypothetical protein
MMDETLVVSSRFSHVQAGMATNAGQIANRRCNTCDYANPWPHRAARLGAVRRHVELGRFPAE